VAFNDLQVEHVAGMLAAALGTGIKSVRRAPLAAMPADGEFPVLAVYRRGEVGECNVRASREVVKADLAIELFLGREEEQNEEDAWSNLPGLLSTIRHTIQVKFVATYPTGAHMGWTLAQLADIEDLKLTPAAYRPLLPAGGSADGPYPAVSLSLTIKYTDVAWKAKALITRINLEENSGVSHETPPIDHTVPDTSFGTPIASRSTP
jgi:hypothetical protein